MGAFKLRRILRQKAAVRQAGGKDKRCYYKARAWILELGLKGVSC